MLLKAAHTVLIPLSDVYTSRRCVEFQVRRSQVHHLQKTARTCGAALIFPYKSILSPLHHLARSSLNSLQFVSILLGPSCLKVNTPFQHSELSPPALSAAQRIPRRALAASRAENGPSPVSKGAISFCSQADCSLFLVSDCQAAALESLWSRCIFRKVTLLVMCAAVSTDE